MLGGAVGRYAAGLAKTHGVATTFAIAGGVTEHKFQIVTPRCREAMALIRNAMAEDDFSCATEDVATSATELAGESREPFPMTLSADILDQITTNPPLKFEVDSAIESIQERPSLLETLLQRPISSGIQSRIFEGVHELLKDPYLIRDACSKMDSIRTKPDMLMSDISTDKEGQPQKTQSALGLKQAGESNCAWEKLLEEFACPICCDVLKAPRIVHPCGHSFCGQCITEYMEKVEPMDGSTEVVHLCPIDRCVFRETTFERQLDDIIYKHVQSIRDGSDDDLVNEWSRRRGIQLDKQNKDDKARHKAASSARSAAAAADGDGNGDGYDVESFLNDFAIPIALVAVISLIVILRLRK